MKLFLASAPGNSQRFIRENQGRIRSAYSIYFNTTYDYNLLLKYIKEVGLNEYKNTLEKICCCNIVSVYENGDLELEGNIRISPNSLAASQRNLLFVEICKKLSEPAAIIGLVESLDSKHRQILNSIAKDNTDKINVLVLDDMLIRKLDMEVC